MKARWMSVIPLEKKQCTLEFTFKENDVALVRNSAVNKEI